MVNIDIAAKALKELGHPTRLAVFKRLVKAGHAGLSVGALQEDLEIPNSTLSHHISSLVSAGLLSQKRDGRTLYCQPDYNHLRAVIDFLEEECCIDQK